MNEINFKSWQVAKLSEGRTQEIYAAAHGRVITRARRRRAIQASAAALAAVIGVVYFFTTPSFEGELAGMLRAEVERAKENVYVAEGRDHNFIREESYGGHI